MVPSRKKGITIGIAGKLTSKRYSAGVVDQILDHGSYPHVALVKTNTISESVC